MPESSNELWFWPNLRHFIAGSASGVALVLAGHAFDTIKVRLQTERTGKFRGPIDCLVRTVKEEGIRGLYKGATPPMLATGCINSVMFGLMGLCKSHLQKDASIEPTISQVMWCGMSTGWIISFLATPMEGIKSRLQVQYALPPGKTPLYRGPIDCAWKLLRGGGVRALYIGWIATIFHRGSNWSYFGGYEIAKRFLTPKEKEHSISPLASIASGAFAGTCFWLSCYPIDVIKNRMQTAPIDFSNSHRYPGIIDCTRSIWKEGGYRAFFKGFTPCLLRSLPANAAAFFAFDLVFNLLPKTI